ncbi:MAG TPA: beta-ketoacyl synthase N-terminal-like domain-containing protein [Tepidisphaeraceae bacterium]|nr:beta-ketoacyl synthase N-terminal-like domain-containing protein [Tepidisphaeraceae bacterium]
MIAVTGMAWITPLGDTVAAVWEKLLSGQSGLRPVANQGRLRNDLAAAIDSPNHSLPPHQRLHKITCDALRRLLGESDLPAGDPDTRLVLGTSLGTYLEDSPDQSLYGWADAVATEIGLTRRPIAVSTACSSGSDAILLGAEMIRMGQAKRCICGGADVLTWSKRIGHSTLGTMSPTTLRAFDLRHDGTLLGEGAGFMLLESDDSRRKPLALFRGAGAANDATAMTAADTTGLSAQYALERSLVDAGLPASAIGLINAHGSGTPMNDLTEKNGLGKVFTAKPGPLVFATKGNFGHSLGATGALEAIALVTAMRTGRVPSIVGLEQPDPEFTLPLAYPKAVEHAAQFGLSLTLGFGGFDTSLIFEVPR